MTPEEIGALLRSDTPLNRARQVFSSECARLEQLSAQRHKPTAIELREQEFKAVLKIVEAYGLT